MIHSAGLLGDSLFSRAHGRWQDAGSWFSEMNSPRFRNIPPASPRVSGRTESLARFAYLFIYTRNGGGKTIGSRFRQPCVNPRARRRGFPVNTSPLVPRRQHNSRTPTKTLAPGRASPIQSDCSEGFGLKQHPLRSAIQFNFAYAVGCRCVSSAMSCPTPEMPTALGL
jgi:hypothetical protein